MGRSIFDKKFGPDFPGETFRVLKEKEEREYGEYRTRRLVFKAWDRSCSIFLLGPLPLTEFFSQHIINIDVHEEQR